VYEAIFEFGGVFYVVRESVNMHAIILELSLTNDNYEYIQECTCEFEFEDSNKGFEGAVGFPDSDGVLHILGLCEGNDCRETKMKSKVGGEGRVVIMKKSTDAVKGCHWETVQVVHIPKSAAFKDYSSIDITSSVRVAISSQESSSVWLSAVSGISHGVLIPVSCLNLETRAALYYASQGMNTATLCTVPMREYTSLAMTCCWQCLTELRMSDDRIASAARRIKVFTHL
jgi:hypothetical protein